MQRHFGGNLTMHLSIFQVRTWNFDTWFGPSPPKQYLASSKNKKKLPTYGQLNVFHDHEMDEKSTDFHCLFWARQVVSRRACSQSRVTMPDPNSKHWAEHSDICLFWASWQAQLVVDARKRVVIYLDFRARISFVSFPGSNLLLFEQASGKKNPGPSPYPPPQKSLFSFFFSLKLDMYFPGL